MQENCFVIMPHVLFSCIAGEDNKLSTVLQHLLLDVIVNSSGLQPFFHIIDPQVVDRDDAGDLHHIFTALRHTPILSVSLLALLLQGSRVIIQLFLLHFQSKSQQNWPFSQILSSNAFNKDVFPST